MRSKRILFTHLLGLGLAAAVTVNAASDPSAIVLDQAGMRNLGIQTVEAEEQTFEETFFAIGRLEDIPESHSVLSSRIAGRVVEVEVFAGDSVKRGDALVTVESRQLGDPPPMVDLVAPQDGIVIESHVRLGQPVEPDADLMDIADRSRLWAVARVPEGEAARIGPGTRARIHIPALGDESIGATLTRFGVDADRNAGTVDAIFEIENPDGRLRPGLRAEFSIILDKRENVIAVPREAVQGDPAKRVVFVRDFDLPNVFLRSPVVLGQQNDAFVEVISGLFPGDEVVTRGSYALNFAGGGSGMSLKDALDAAHGHEHNEDGSEMNDAQRAAKQKAAGEDDAAPTKSGPGLTIYAGVVTVLLLVVTQRWWNLRRKGDS